MKVKYKVKNAVVQDLVSEEFSVTSRVYRCLDELKLHLGSRYKFICWVEESAKEHEELTEYVKIKIQVGVSDIDYKTPKYNTFYIIKDVYENASCRGEKLSHINLLRISNFALDDDGNIVKHRYSLEMLLDYITGINND